MGRWQFRRTRRFGPLRVTFTRSGVGISFGIGPLRWSRGADGKWRRTTRVGPIHKTDRTGDPR